MQWIDEADWHPYCSAYMQYGWQMGEPDSDGECVADFMWKPVTQYLYDGTAALRLVEQFRLQVFPAYRGGGFECYPQQAGWMGCGDAPNAAIVACVCELAKAEWPYKEAK